MRQPKSYAGELMSKGEANEAIICEWLKTYFPKVIDLRHEEYYQRADVDYMVSKGNATFLVELKSDNYISENGNLCFEVNRINHNVPGGEYYLGWGWRSKADKLIVRNPNTGKAFAFDFPKLRRLVSEYVAKYGKDLESKKLSANNKNFMQIKLILCNS